MDTDDGAQAAEAPAEAEGPAPVPAPAPAEAEAPAPTHDLLLSDGQVIPSTGAIPTLVHLGDRILSVVRAFERKHAS